MLYTLQAPISDVISSAGSTFFGGSMVEIFKYYKFQYYQNLQSDKAKEEEKPCLSVSSARYRRIKIA